jgi:hypothetical protein
VGDLARDVLAVNHGRLVEEVGSWNKKDVWEALCRVIVIQTGIASKKLRKKPASSTTWVSFDAADTLPKGPA